MLSSSVSQAKKHLLAFVSKSCRSESLHVESKGKTFLEPIRSLTTINTFVINLSREVKKKKKVYSMLKGKKTKKNKNQKPLKS